MAHGQMGRPHKENTARPVQERDGIAAHGHAAKRCGKHRCEQQHIDRSRKNPVGVVLSFEDRRIPVPVQNLVDDHGQRHGNADPLVQRFPCDLIAHQAEQKQKQERVNDQAEGISFPFLHGNKP